MKPTQGPVVYLTLVFFSTLAKKINGLLSHVVFLTKYGVYQIIRVQIVAQCTGNLASTHRINNLSKEGATWPDYKNGHFDWEQSPEGDSEPHYS